METEGSNSKRCLFSHGVLFIFVISLFLDRYLHSKNFLHRDLKSKNILLESTTFVAKLCDFGFAREQTNKDQILTVKVGTDVWMAPEVITGSSYDFKAVTLEYLLIIHRMSFHMESLCLN